MPLLNKPCRLFLESYRAKLTEWDERARRLGSLVEDLLSGHGVYVHTVSARCKDVDSLRAKLRKKAYKNPEQQATDLLGVRVITYYQDDVDTAVRYLKQDFDIDLKKSIDKRTALDLYEFGYRSVHLIARLTKARSRQPDFKLLANVCWEIQVRSVLEHAWAELNHEMIYKGGYDYPDLIKRQFAAVAGTLELLDGQFLQLRSGREDLIKRRTKAFERGKGLREKLDSSRLIAFLMVERPDGLSWAKARQSAAPFPPGIEASCVEALAEAGIRTPRSLRERLAGRHFRALASAFARNQGIAKEQISHLAVVVLAVMADDANLLREHFPEMLYDPSLGLLM